MKHAIIRIRADEPNYSAIPDAEHEWVHTMCEGAKEITPINVPNPLGKCVLTSS
jgi:hypothetical protein